MDSYGQIVLFLLLIFFHEGWSLRCACTKDLKQCASIHETPADFQSAKSACKAKGGELMRAGTSRSNETITALLTDTTGDFWSEVETKDKSAGNKTRTVPRCLAVSKVKKWTERACEHRVDGFLCVGVRWDATCSVDTAQTAIIMDKSACSMAPCEHACKEIGNGYTCHCKKTHRPQRKDPRRCDYFCLSTPCKQLCDIPGSCKCPEGFVQDSDTCADIDECTSNHNCQHTCHNTLGSYECSCNEGYDLVNGSACVSRFTTTTEGMFITPSLNHSLSGRATLASPGEYVGIVVFVLAALFGLLLVARYLRKRKSKVGLKDCDDLDIVPQEL